MEKNGGRPKKETTGFEKEKTSGYFQKKPNVNENVNNNYNVNVDASNSYVEDLKKAIDFYNNNISIVTPYTLEVFEDYTKKMQADLIILAMKKAVEANKRTIQYIKGILNNWLKKGIKTVIDAEKEDEEFKNKNIIQEETEEQKKARKIKELEEALKNDTK